MSDGVLERLIAALDRNSAAQEAVVAALKGAKAAGGAPGGAAAGAKTTEVPKTGTGGAAGGAKKKTTVEDVAAAFGGYLKGAGDQDERANRAANIKSIVDYFGVAKATLLDPKHFDEAIGYLNTYIAGGTPEFAGAAEEDGESLV